jgi:ubiquitin fusion degradation protein 1
MFGFGGYTPRERSTFESHYFCFSMAVIDRVELESGDKILLPASALRELASMNVQYPMLFELRNPAKGKSTHCGVLEFSAEEGKAILPFWMMQNLQVDQGDRLVVKNVSIPKATYVKFRPLDESFLDLSNPRVVLEKALRTYSCLTEGDVISVEYDGSQYPLEVLELKPQKAVSIIETDCEVDFQVPERQVPLSESKGGRMDEEGGEEEPNTPSEHDPSVLQYAKTPAEDEKPQFVAFSGKGRRLDGKPLGGKDEEEDEEDEDDEHKGGRRRKGQAHNLKPHQQHWSSSSVGRSLASGELVRTEAPAEGKDDTTQPTTQTKPIKKIGYGNSSVKHKFSKTKNLSGFAGSGNRLG